MQGRLTQQDLEKVGRMLSRDHGITLRCEGHQAYARRSDKLVVIPALPDAGIVDGSMLRNIRFFLDHEVGHLVGESSDESCKRVKEKWGDKGFAVLNALEDVRVEALMSEIWAGCKANLDGGRKPLLETMELKLRSAMKHSGDRPHPCRQVVLAIYRRGSGMKSVGLDYMDDDLIRRAIGDASADPCGIKTIPLWASRTEDLEPTCDRIMNAIVQKIREDQTPQPEPRQEGEGGGGQGEGEATDGGAGESQGEGEAKDGGSDGKEGQPRQGGGGESGEASSGESQTPQPRDAADPADGGAEGGSGSSGPSPRSLIESAEDQSVNERGVSDIADMAARQLSACPVQDHTGDLPTAPAQTPPVGFGQVQRPNSVHGGASVERLRKAAQVSGGAGRQRLVQMLQSEDRSWWQGGRDRGAPDPARLASLASGTSDRVMRRRQYHKAKTTAVSLLLDGSGSMHGDRPQGEPIIIAAEVAAGLLQACSLGGVRAECCAFTGGTHHGGGPELALVQRFGQRFDRRPLDNLAAYTRISGGGTPLASSLWVMGHRLLAQREAPRKVLIANTDGGASDPRRMRPTIEYLEARGVEVVLIGIRCDLVKMYHHKHAVVKDLADLGSTTMRELAKHLHVGRHAA